MHTWPNQVGTALHESIVTGEAAPPPTRLGKGSPYYGPIKSNVECLPVCSRQLDISLVWGQAWPVCMSVWQDTKGRFLSYGVNLSFIGRAKRGWTSQHKEVRSKPITLDLAGKAGRPLSRLSILGGNVSIKCSKVETALVQA